MAAFLVHQGTSVDASIPWKCSSTRFPWPGADTGSPRQGCRGARKDTGSEDTRCPMRPSSRAFLAVAPSLFLLLGGKLCPVHVTFPKRLQNPLPGGHHLPPPLLATLLSLVANKGNTPSPGTPSRICCGRRPVVCLHSGLVSSRKGSQVRL